MSPAKAQTKPTPQHKSPTNKRGIAAGIGKHTRRLGLGALGFFLAVAVWQAIYALDIIRPGLLPSPFAVFTETMALITGAGSADIIVSTRRVLLGVLIGVTAAIPVGFLLGWYRTVRALLDPLMNFLRALPPIALVPLVIVYLGIGERARLVILVYAAFFAGVVILYEGIVSIDPIYIRAAQVLGINRKELFFKVVLPLTVPHILTALRVALGVAWATLVAAELIAAQTGLGAVIQRAQNFFQISRIYAGILLIGALALIMDRTVRVSMNYLVRWQERVDR